MLGPSIITVGLGHLRMKRGRRLRLGLAVALVASVRAQNGQELTCLPDRRPMVSPLGSNCEHLLP